MAQQIAGGSDQVAMAGQPPALPPDADQTVQEVDGGVADLLDLVADAHEEAEDLRSRLRQAEARALRAEDDLATLRAEVEGMTVSMIELDRVAHRARVDLAAAEARMATLQSSTGDPYHPAPPDGGTSPGEVARLTAELHAAHDAARRLQAELDALRASTSWRLTAPLRAVGQRSIRPR